MEGKAAVTVRERRRDKVILSLGPILGAAVGAITNLITSAWSWWLFLALILLVSLAAAATVAASAPRRNSLGVSGKVSPARQISTLPARTAVFVNRSRELGRFATFESSAATAGRPVVYMITGRPGSGKTALATQAAHRLAEHYPDAQLFFGFHSHSGTASRLGAHDVLIDALAVLSPEPVHRSLNMHQLSALWRSDTNGRRMLLVFDDVADLAQAAPLLPNSSGCVVIITGRQMVPGIDPDVHIDLGDLSNADAMAMIREITLRSSQVVDDAVIDSLARVYTLPLSVRHVADRLVSGSIDRIRGLMTDHEGSGDPTRAFRATIASLTEAEQLVFRRAALYPGTHATGATVGALAGIAADEADAALVTLHNLGLVGKPDPDGYQFHDLVRGIALEYLDASDTDAERADARHRLFELTIEILAELNVLINALPRTDTAVGYGVKANIARDEYTALEWYERYFEDMRAIARLAIEYEWYGTWKIACKLSYFMRIRRSVPQAIELIESALQIALTGGDDLGRAVCHLEIGILQRVVGSYVSAQEHVNAALPIFTARSDILGQAGCFLELNTNYHLLSRYKDALESALKALPLFERAGNMRGIAEATAALGMLNRLLGNYRSAWPYLERALAIFADIGSHRNRAWILIELGTVDRQLGRYEQAIGRFTQSRELYDRADDRNGRAWADRELGIAFRMTGNYQEAELKLNRSLEVFTGIGRMRNFADTSIELATLHRLTGELAQARQEAVNALDIYQGIGNIRGASWAEIELSVIERPDDHSSAVRRLERVLSVYTEMGDQSGLARTYFELGAAAIAVNNSKVARDHLNAALSIYETIGSPEADNARAQLATLNFG
jgi:tetratricopeptide (TPR) repeat protein